MRILFIFLDGIGLGAPDQQYNPFAVDVWPQLRRLGGGHAWTAAMPFLSDPNHVVRHVDANLGVEGLPQSGTGQATLFTGINCAELAGRHYGPYPHSKTRAAIAEHNIFSRVKALGVPKPLPVTFTNAYPPRFFELVQRRDRWSVTTRCCLDAGVRIRTHQDVVQGSGLTADLTARGWQQFTEDPVPVITEREAGLRYVTISKGYVFSLFEYFLSDKAGHSQSMEKATEVLHALDQFFDGILASLDISRDLLIITSDHGNLEDLRVKTHTRNSVPFIAWGYNAHAFTDVLSIQDITPRLEAILKESLVKNVHG